MVNCNAWSSCTPTTTGSPGYLNSIGDLASLSRLNLQGNRLSELPETIGQLTHLTDLDLRFNQLVSLPASLTRLQSLEYLDLRANALTTLPDNLDRLTHLRKLDLRWNQLRVSPAMPGCALQTWLHRLYLNQFIPGLARMYDAIWIHTYTDHPDGSSNFIMKGFTRCTVTTVRSCMSI